MKRIIYGSLSVLTAVGTVFLAAKAEVFNGSNGTADVSEQLDLEAGGELTPLDENGFTADASTSDGESALNALSSLSSDLSKADLSEGSQAKAPKGDLAGLELSGGPSGRPSGGEVEVNAAQPLRGFTSSPASTVPGIQPQPALVQIGRPPSSPIGAASSQVTASRAAVPAQLAQATPVPAAAPTPAEEPTVIPGFSPAQPSGSATPAPSVVPGSEDTALPSPAAGMDASSPPAVGELETAQDAEGGIDSGTMETSPGGVPVEEPLPEEPVDTLPEEPVDTLPEEPVDTFPAEEPVDTLPEEPVDTFPSEEPVDTLPEEPVDTLPEEPVDTLPEEPLPEEPVDTLPEEPLPEGPVDTLPEEPMPEEPMEDTLPEEPLPGAPESDFEEAPVPGGIEDGLPGDPGVEPVDPSAPVEPVEPLPPAGEDTAPEPLSEGGGDRLIGEGFTAFQLSYLALGGGLKEQGIPGGGLLVKAYKAGELTAEDIVAAGAESKRLGTAADDEADYTKSVDKFLKLFVRDARPSSA